ncbi:hypothetical protein ACFL1P_01790 [Patescibacteria group bacterium]
MDYTDQAITYGLLMLPTFFALAVVGQGVQKIQRQDSGGKTVLGFGIMFLVFIGIAVVLFVTDF